jgi:hypothetical protein
MITNKRLGTTISNKTSFHIGTTICTYTRVTRRDALRVLVNDKDSKEDDVVKNIVYKEIF